MGYYTTVAVDLTLQEEGIGPFLHELEGMRKTIGPEIVWF